MRSGENIFLNNVTHEHTHTHTHTHLRLIREFMELLSIGGGGGMCWYGGGGGEEASGATMGVFTTPSSSVRAHRDQAH